MFPARFAGRKKDRRGRCFWCPRENNDLVENYDIVIIDTEEKRRENERWSEGDDGVLRSRGIKIDFVYPPYRN